MKRRCYKCGVIGYCRTILEQVFRHDIRGDQHVEDDDASEREQVEHDEDEVGGLRASLLLTRHHVRSKLCDTLSQIHERHQMTFAFHNVTKVSALSEDAIG